MKYVLLSLILVGCGQQEAGSSASGVSADSKAGGDRSALADLEEAVPAVEAVEAAEVKEEAAEPTEEVVEVPLTEEVITEVVVEETTEIVPEIPVELPTIFRDLTALYGPCDLRTEGFRISTGLMVATCSTDDLGVLKWRGYNEIAHYIDNFGEE
jgi:hypothetical protein